MFTEDALEFIDQLDTYEDFDDVEIADDETDSTIIQELNFED